MTRQAIDERDALRRTVARQDKRIAELEAELRKHRAITAYHGDRRPRHAAAPWPETPRITQWDRQAIPEPVGTLVNLHIGHRTLLGDAHAFSLDTWAVADWYSRVL